MSESRRRERVKVLLEGTESTTTQTLSALLESNNLIRVGSRVYSAFDYDENISDRLRLRAAFMGIFGTLAFLIALIVLNSVQDKLIEFCVLVPISVILVCSVLIILNIDGLTLRHATPKMTLEEARRQFDSD